MKSWTITRLGEAQRMLDGGFNLGATAKNMGITRAALCMALVRHEAMPEMICSFNKCKDHRNAYSKD
jgi:hypothetical protein